LVALDAGRAISVYELENLAASPLRFEVDGAKLAPLLFEIEEAGQQAAIYHSHTHSEPYPSQTDVNFARWWPGCEWLIIGLENDGQPLARSFMISADGVIEELAVEIDG
jgi:proteasome lid subunit RPN8/RPN11